MDLGLRGKAAIVAGGSRGIGKAISLGLASEGCQVALAARGEEALRQVAAEIEGRGAKALPVPGDLALEPSAERLVQETLAQFGRIDILVNSLHLSTGPQDDAAWRQAFEVIFFTAVRLTRLVAPHMRSAGGGSVIHLASIWGREAGGSATYNAMKAALISHAKSMALQFAADNIRVNSVAPGSVSHPGGSWWRRQQEDPEGMANFVQQNIPMGRFGSAEEIANVVVFLCSPRASWVTGACIPVDGGQGHSNI